MSAQRARSAVAADHRSIHPGLAGVPWWAAVVIATAATALGFAYDAGSGNKDLTSVFSALYVTGCVVAVLTVRQSGVFTAVIQPPLILFCTVPGVSWLLHGAKVGGLKNLLINCGYPLIERFPLMLFTSAGVLLIGMIRWYLGSAARGAPTADTKADDATTGRRADGIAARFTSLWRREAAGEAERPSASTSRRGRPVGKSKSAKPAGKARSAKRAAPTRSRHARPPLDDKPELPGERARRRRPVHARDLDTADAPVTPRRRPRPPRESDLRGQPPREIRRDPHLRAGRPTARSTRFDPYEPVEPYEPLPRRRTAWSAASATGATHHPISRVRYRGAADGQPGTDARAGSSGRHTAAAESWEYDI